MALDAAVSPSDSSSTQFRGPYWGPFDGVFQELSTR